jgi:hypothetical protein
MLLHQAIKQHLEADTSVETLMGGRFFYGVIPQKITTDGASRVPCVVYERRGVNRQVTYCGTNDLIQTLVTLDVYALTYSAARELATGVRRSLIDFRGLLSGVVSVRAASLDTEFDLQDMEPGLFRVSQSWTFWHEEE